MLSSERSNFHERKIKIHILPLNFEKVTYFWLISYKDQVSTQKKEQKPEVGTRSEVDEVTCPEKRK